MMNNNFSVLSMPTDHGLCSGRRIAGSALQAACCRCKKKAIAVLLFAIGAVWAVAGQNAEMTAEDYARTQAALATPDYRVTPGDIYQLSYAIRGSAISTKFVVDSSYKIRIHNLGLLDGRGKTFQELKQQVELLVSKNYPLSGVQFVLQVPGYFSVCVRGEVLSVGEVRADSLTRLYNFYMRLDKTAKASDREVRVISADGTVHVYDLFAFYRGGDFAHNPYLQPGDTVVVPAGRRKVSVGGEVLRPGTYDIRDGESLRDAVEKYGGGFTMNSDRERIFITRIDPVSGADVASGAGVVSGVGVASGVSTASGGASGVAAAGDAGLPGGRLREQRLGAVSGVGIAPGVMPDVGGCTYTLSEADIDSSPVAVLHDLDRIVVGSRQAFSFVAAFEGALDLANQNAENTAGVADTQRLLYRFKPGVMLSHAVMELNGSFRVTADLANAYMIRSSGILPVNCWNFLYKKDFTGDVALENGDVIIIPQKPLFVLVSGAVVAPGKYPYIPDRDIHYYINLAGGIRETTSTGRNIRVTDMNNSAISAAGTVRPESKIYVPFNSFSYNFNKYAPVITTLLSITGTTLSIMSVSGAFN